MRREVTNINTNQIKRMKMKRTLVSLLSLLALSSLFTITSCQKEATGDGSQFRATMEGCTARDSKTTLDETFLHLNWVEGDQVAIYGTAGRGLYSATPQTPATTAVFDNVGGTTGDGPFRAFYPASLTSDGASVTLPATQTYEVNSIHEFPMYAESATNQLAFKNLCGALRLILREANTNITSISVTANTAICGDYAVNYVDDVPYLSYTGNGSNTVTMNFSTPLSIGDTGRYFYFALPAFDSLKSITITTDDGRYCTKTVKSNVCINVQRSEMTTIVFLDNDMDFVEPLPEGALPGLFSVSATQQVRFSQGNLQYSTTGSHATLDGTANGTWQFANTQYENADNSLGWIDSFCWGTSGWNSGANLYFPTDISQSSSDFYPGGSNLNDLTGNYANADWGVYNAISNGGNIPNMWRTLTSDEWAYIFRDRPNARQKFALGIINGVWGVIILPDNWTLPQGCNFTPNYSDYGGSGTYLGSASNNTYTLSQWVQMEEAGAVFFVNGSPYWSASHYSGTYGYNNLSKATRFAFVSTYMTCHDGSSRHEQNHVRLVQNADI